MFSTEKEEIVYNVLNIFATKKPPENHYFPGGFFRSAVQTWAALGFFYSAYHCTLQQPISLVGCCSPSPISVW